MVTTLWQFPCNFQRKSHSLRSPDPGYFTTLIYHLALILCEPGCHVLAPGPLYLLLFLAGTHFLCMVDASPPLALQQSGQAEITHCQHKPPPPPVQDGTFSDKLGYLIKETHALKPAQRSHHFQQRLSRNEGVHFIHI